MTFIRLLLLFLALLVQGCAERFLVTKKVFIVMKKDKSVIVDFKGREIAQITDFWVHGKYLYGYAGRFSVDRSYGYRYREREYVMFLIDLHTNRFIEGMEAHKIVRKKGLPLNRWMNGIELFGDYISDIERRSLFIKAVRESRSDAQN